MSVTFETWWTKYRRECVYLVVVVVAVEERLLPEDHAGQHAAQAPHVQTVVIHLDEDSGGKKREKK